MDDLIKKITEQQKQVVRDMIKKERRGRSSSTSVGSGQSQAYTEYNNKKNQDELNNTLNTIQTKNTEQDGRLNVLENNQNTNTNNIGTLTQLAQNATSKNIEQDARLDSVENRVIGIDYVARNNARINTINITKNFIRDAVRNNLTQFDMLQGYANTLQTDEKIDYTSSKSIIYDPATKTVRPDLNAVKTLVGANQDSSIVPFLIGSDREYNPHATIKINEFEYETYIFGGGGTSPNTNLYRYKNGAYITLPNTGTYTPVNKQGGMCYVSDLNSLFMYCVNSSTGAKEFSLYHLDTQKWENINSLFGTNIGLIGNRLYQGITYDSNRKKILISGGYLGAAYNSTCYQIDINTWGVTSFNGPLLPQRPVFYYLSWLDKTFYFGSNGGTVNNNTYMLNTSNLTWEAIATANKPASKNAMQSVVLDGIGIIMFGGVTNGVPSTTANEFWLFDGTNWMQIPVTNPVNLYGGIAMLDYYNNKLYLRLGKGSQNSGNFYSIELIFTGSNTKMLQLTAYNISNPAEVILTVQTVTQNTAPNCEVSLDNGTTFYPIEIDSVFSTEGKNNGNKTIFKFHLQDQTEMVGWGINWT